MLLFTLFFSVFSHAFRLEPMVLALPVTKPVASGTYLIENNTAKKIAVEFQVRRRVNSDQGQESRPEAAGFLVYPEQMALEPGEKRSVRVSWQGESLPKREEAYRLVASQLPVDFSKEKAVGGAQLKFLVEYVASLYLVPPGVKPKMKMVKFETKGDSLAILIENEGNAHFLLEKMNLVFKAGKKEGRPEAARLADLRTENILAGEKRWLKVPIPKGFGKVTDARVDFEP